MRKMEGLLLKLGLPSRKDRVKVVVSTSHVPIPVSSLCELVVTSQFRKKDKGLGKICLATYTGIRVIKSKEKPSAHTWHELSPTKTQAGMVLKMQFFLHKQQRYKRRGKYILTFQSFSLQFLEVEETFQDLLIYRPISQVFAY